MEGLERMMRFLICQKSGPIDTLLKLKNSGLLRPIKKTLLNLLRLNLAHFLLAIFLVVVERGELIGSRSLVVPAKNISGVVVRIPNLVLLLAQI